MGLSFDEIKSKVTGQQRSGKESFDEIKARVSKMNMTSSLTADDVNNWFKKSRELEDKTTRYLSSSGTYDGWKGAANPADELHDIRLQEASVRAWMNRNKDAENYADMMDQINQYSKRLGTLESGVRDTASYWRDTPIGQIESELNENTKKQAELKGQIQNTGSQSIIDKIMRMATTGDQQDKSPTKESLQIRRELDSLEYQRKELEKLRDSYIENYNIPSDPDELKKAMSDTDSRIAALESKLKGMPVEGSAGPLLSKVVTSEQRQNIGTKEEKELLQEIQKLKSRRENMDFAMKRNEYSKIPDAEDFETYSKDVKSTVGGAFGLKTDQLYEYINNIDGYRTRTDMSIGTGGGSWPEKFSLSGWLTDEEIGIYNYLYRKEGKQAANEYFSYMTPELQNRREGTVVQRAETLAQEHPVASSIMSIPLNMVSGIGYLENAARAMTGKEMTTKSQAQLISTASDAVREQVTQDIEKNWGKVGSFGYQVGMSMADFLTSLAVSGGNEAFTLAIMGTSAASRTAKSAKEKGLDDNRAFMLGTLAGAAEVVFEKVSLDHLLKIGSKTGIAAKILDVLGQAGVEGSEEIITDIANELADRLVSGDISEYNLRVRAYVQDGMSLSEAKKKADSDFAEQLALSGLGGFVSGGMLGGGSVALNNTLGTRQIGRDVIRSGNVNATISDGLNLDVNDPLYRAAAELAMRQTEGNKLPARKVGELELGLESKAYNQMQEMYQKAIQTAGEGTKQPSPVSVDAQSETAQNGHLNANTDTDTNAVNTINAEMAKPMDAQARMGNADVTVRGISSVQDGDVVVQLDGGKTVPLYDVEIQNPEIRQLYDTAAKYDTNTAKAFVSGFDGSLPISTYQTAFDYFVTQAQHGVSLEDATEYAGLIGQMMSPMSRQTAYFAGQNLQSSGSRDTMGAKNAAMGGMNNVSVRQDQKPSVKTRGGTEDVSGRPDGRGREGIGKRSGISEAGGRNVGGVTRRTVETRRGRPIEFNAVEDSALSEKQKRLVEESKSYGYDLFFSPRGSEFTYGGKSRVIDWVAFVPPGERLVFASYETKLDFLHHELFHHFLKANRHKESALFKKAQRSVVSKSAFKKYVALCEKHYKRAVSKKLVLEEITCDLCEYAMSGSKPLYNRLNGLFEGDSLETLAKQAREVFEANREAYQAGKGQKNPDIRLYMDDAVEEVKDLVAVHNLSADKLKSAFDLGGFPMPSIAVTKADMGHEKFGDISLIFDKETINPADRRNKVYGGDAWTPSFPTVEYKISDKKASEVRRRIDKLVDPDIKREFSLVLDPDNMDDMVNRRGGDAVEAYRDNDAMRLAYLRDEGIAFEASKKPKTYSHDAKAIERLIEQVPDAVDAMENYAGYDELMQYEPKVREVLNSYYQSKIGASIFDKKLGFRDLDAALRDAVKIRKEGAPEVVDRYGTRDRLNELFEEHPEYEAKYLEWLENLFDGLVEKKGIRNSKNPFTPSGNRRSFEALHDEYTLDNIVKSMKGDAEKGGALFHSANTVAAASTREYGSISDVKQDKGRLSRMTDDEREAIKKGFEDRLSDIVSRMTANIKGGNIFSHISNATEAITETLAKSNTASSIKKGLKSWGQFTVTDDIVSDILSLSKDMANAPTEYFEAKPQRAVGFDEVKAAVVPDTLDGDLKTQLEAAGIKTVEYKDGDSADRVRALNEAPELRFYMEDITPVDTDVLMEENQKLREQVETLRQEFVLTKGHKAKPASLEKLASGILKETSSSYDKGTLVKNLETLFSYIANDPEANFDEAMEVSAEIANSVLRDSETLDSSLYDQYKDMREYFRKTAISLDEDVRDGMDYDRFRKEQFGGIRLTNDGASLDSLWPKLCERWPEFFRPDISVQDQPAVVADALKSIKPVYTNLYDLDATEAAYDLAFRIYEGYFDLPEVKTFADKKAAELEQLRAKYENRMEAMRKEYKARENRLVQEQRQKRQDLKDENRLKLAAQMERAREQRKAATSKRKESALVRRYKPRIVRDTVELGRWLTHPTDQKHVPEPFRKAVAEFVNTIDFSSRRLNSEGNPTMRTMAMQKLQNQMNTILNSESGSYGDMQAMLNNADPDLIPNMADLIQNAERVRIEDMTGEQLKNLAHVVSALKSMLTNANRLISDGRVREAGEVAGGIHNDLLSLKDAKEHAGVIGSLQRLLSYDMMDAPSYFEELGETAFRELYRPLRRGFDRKIRNTAEAVAYMQNVLKGINTEEWSGNKAKKHTFKLSGGTVSLTAAQIMSLYELSKREQARGHILGGGIRPSDTVKGFRIDKSKSPVTMTFSELNQIVKTLTPEQRTVADKIADFFKTTAEWGNEVSMRLYGYRKFTEQNYFPIVSDKNYITTLQGDFRHPDAMLKNLGATKSTIKGANNPIMVEDIFDVFTRQADQMGSYNAFVVPLDDMHKVLNYKVTSPGGKTQGSMRESMDRALGRNAVAYWNKLVQDINGMSRQEAPTLSDKLLSNMKAAAVGANVRVVIQQPTAYLRAAAMIDPKYLAKGLAMKSDIDEMNRYAPIAYWKDLGFFEMDTSRGMRDILMSKEGLRDKAMKPAGWADTKTWGKLWNAVKLEVQETTNLKPGSEAFLEESGKRFSDIIDRTQVVDSVLHRSQVMRSKNFANKVVTSFMSEPTKSYNMLRSAARNVQKNGWKSGGGRLARAAVTHTVTSIVTALAAALVDAARDDDKDKDWLQKFLSASGENILDNLNPLNMLPYAKELVSLLSGYSLTRQEMAGLVDVVNAGKNWATYFSGDSKYSIPWLIKNSAASISKLTGIPLASVTRDLEGMVRGAVQIASDSGLPTTGLEYTLDTFYYPVIPKNASRYAEYVYDAYKEKNPKLAQDILTAMEKGGISEDKITYSMRKVLRESDPRIAEAARAKMDGNMSSYAKIVGELRNEGFDREWVIGAVDGWISNVKNAAKKKEDGKQKEYKESAKELEDSGVEREWLENTVDRLIGNKRPEDESEDEEEYEGIYEGSDIVTAVESGNLSEAKTVIQELLSNGKKESSIRASVTRYYKPIYQDLYKKKDESGMRKIRETLAKLGIGYKADDFTRWI